MATAEQRRAAIKWAANLVHRCSLRATRDSKVRPWAIVAKERGMIRCHVCGGSGAFYQEGRSIPCYVCDRGWVSPDRAAQFDAYGERAA